MHIELEVTAPFWLDVGLRADEVNDPDGFLVGSAPVLRLRFTDPRTGVLVDPDTARIVWLRDPDGVDVATDVDLMDPDEDFHGGIGSFTWQIPALTEAGRYQALVEASEGDAVLRRTHVWAVTQP